MSASGQKSSRFAFEPDNYDALVDQHAPLVKRIAYHLKARLPAHIQVDDLFQSGMIGLLEAARNYRPNESASFETFASIRIRGAMLDELRKNNWTPKSVHRKIRDLSEAIRKVESRVGRDARDSEIISEMGITADEYHRILVDGSACNLYSLDQMIAGEENYTIQNDNSGKTDPYNLVQSGSIKEHLSGAIKSLPERERMIISLYYDAELNLKEIGKVIGVSESRASQLMSQAVARLRARLLQWKDK